MATKMTAVQWLEIAVQNKLASEMGPYFQEAFEQAKAMEKEQMDKVSEDWWVEGCSYMKDNKRIYESFEQYYTSTFNL
jgi:hypothetical protein